MTSGLPAVHMYAEPAVHFRDPFGPKDTFIPTARPTHHQYHPYLDLNRALTPPPDMHGASHAAMAPYQDHDRARRYDGQWPQLQSCRAPTGQHYPQEVSIADFGRNGAATQPASRALSPLNIYQQPMANDVQSYSRQPKASDSSAIAPAFQIPKTVNDSGGSLAELAAQITCLFWFESAELLRQIEDSSSPIQPPKQLALDARPSTGFKKWVTTILATTMVAQNVVLLALLFIHRLKKLNPTVRGKPGSEYRLLTVALMLGNKFLDDNTYTNKTWAEVSGINVSEVHIMEVEFLSNMKYCLFASAEDWAKWQTLLGKFASFIERANRPKTVLPPAPILPPASSLYLPVALPSPPASNQASPPYVPDAVPHVPAYTNQFGLTPAPSPMTYAGVSQAHSQNPRKRSHEDCATEPAAKRIASSHQSYNSPQYYASAASQASLNPPGSSRPPALPSLASSVTQNGLPTLPQPVSQQLPPLNIPARAMAMVYPNANSHAQLQHGAVPAHPAAQPSSQVQSRQQSPYIPSATTSPSRGLPHPAANLQPSLQVSPTYYLQQRNSPYRPVHHMSTLTYPPTTSAMQEQPQNVAYDQMQYQPLGKRIQQAQTGRLPYVRQNIWTDGEHEQNMTPVFNWPGMSNHYQAGALSQR